MYRKVMSTKKVLRILILVKSLKGLKCEIRSDAGG